MKTLKYFVAFESLVFAGVAAAKEVTPELPPLITNCEMRVNRSLTGKRAYYYCDDAIWFLRDLARQRPKSLFDNPFLKALKTVHDKYGFKLQVNCFYRTDFFYGMDEFTMAEMPETWKAEWQANKDWLKLGFHSLQEFPDYPLVNSNYEDVHKLASMIRGEIERFAGPGVFARFAVVHWGTVSKEGCRALKDCGIRLLQAQCGPRHAYNGDTRSLPYGHAARLLQNRKPETEVFERISENEAIASSVSGYNNLTMAQGKAMYGRFDYLYDFETGLGMKETEDMQPLSAGLNLYTPATLRVAFEKVLGNEFVIYGNHEQYFYKDYLAYQPDYLEKMMLAAKILTENGYVYGFAEELVEEGEEESWTYPIFSSPVLTAPR